MTAAARQSDLNCLRRGGRYEDLSDGYHSPFSDDDRGAGLSLTQRQGAEASVSRDGCHHLLLVGLLVRPKLLTETSQQLMKVCADISAAEGKNLSVFDESVKRFIHLVSVSITGPTQEQILIV